AGFEVAHRVVQDLEDLLRLHRADGGVDLAGVAERVCAPPAGREVHGQGHVAGLGEPAGDVLEMPAQPLAVVDDENARVYIPALGRGEVPEERTGDPGILGRPRGDRGIIRRDRDARGLLVGWISRPGRARRRPRARQRTYRDGQDGDEAGLPGRVKELPDMPPAVDPVPPSVPPSHPSPLVSPSPLCNANATFLLPPGALSSRVAPGRPPPAGGWEARSRSPERPAGAVPWHPSRSGAPTGRRPPRAG